MVQQSGPISARKMLYDEEFMTFTWQRPGISGGLLCVLDDGLLNFARNCSTIQDAKVADVIKDNGTVAGVELE